MSKENMKTKDKAKAKIPASFRVEADGRETVSFDEYWAMFSELTSSPTPTQPWPTQPKPKPKEIAHPFIKVFPPAPAPAALPLLPSVPGPGSDKEIAGVKIPNTFAMCKCGNRHQVYWQVSTETDAGTDLTKGLWRSVDVQYKMIYYCPSHLQQFDCTVSSMRSEKRKYAIPIPKLQHYESPAPAPLTPAPSRSSVRVDMACVNYASRSTVRLLLSLAMSKIASFAESHDWEIVAEYFTA